MMRSQAHLCGKREAMEMESMEPSVKFVTLAEDDSAHCGSYSEKLGRRGVFNLLCHRKQVTVHLNKHRLHERFSTVLLFHTLIRIGNQT